ncbi:MAG: hypothetical protein ACOWW1_03990 [archaeon]|nr:hypothetical protein [Candidatus Bathyarchaeum sp.]
MGYRKIDALMKDPLIKDISVDGVGSPPYVWYSDYESFPANISFKDSLELNLYIFHFAYLAKKNISVFASPTILSTIGYVKRCFSSKVGFNVSISQLTNLLIICLTFGFLAKLPSSSFESFDIYCLFFCKNPRRV